MTEARTTRVRTTALGMVFVACVASVVPASAQSLTDRFRSLFGGGSPATSQPSSGTPSENAASETDCPAVNVRAGASTYAVGLPDKPAAGADLRYQATITRTARDCTASGGQVIARIGIQGRVIAGPAGTPASVDVPLRIAVVQDGIVPKTITTKAYRTSVAMQSSTSAAFSFVADDIVYPTPSAADGDQYVFYVGFDPQALAPEKPARKKK